MPRFNRLPMQHLPGLRGGSSVTPKASRVPALFALMGALMLITALTGCASPGVQQYDPWADSYGSPACLPDAG
jgi:hypothetical protein